ncbi:uncharacterized protein LOC126660215 [Mercurialis annua]|uniref:uncharacterized protein LOC126660215 n=1 Tax=Mercurialis annua TaxID=3986 RepID=UPI00215DDF63|nr:uncharacterized protein LOC126660215 [Mercurialis annua]
MAALSLTHNFIHNNKSSTQGLKTRNYTKVVAQLSCQGDQPIDNSTPKVKKELKKVMMVRQVLSSLEKLGKGVKDSLSPKQKGDWKDVVLMSLSFAVYVYISQQIVCAYCAWNSMFK